MSKCKKILRKVVVILLAIALVVIDLPISHNMEVKASNDGKISSITYSVNGNEYVLDELSTSEINIGYINPGEATSVDITIIYDADKYEDGDTSTIEETTQGGLPENPENPGDNGEGEETSSQGEETSSQGEETSSQGEETSSQGEESGDFPQNPDGEGQTGNNVTDLEIRNDNDIISATTSIEIGKLYQITVGQGDDKQIYKVQLVSDTTDPVIDSVTDDNEYENEEDRISYSDSEANIVAAGTKVRIYVTEENIDKLLVYIDGVEDDENVSYTDIEEGAYFEYTVEKTASYKFELVDKAGNVAEKTMTFTVDDGGPSINTVVDANDETVYRAYDAENDEHINYVNGDTVSLKISFEDELSKVTSISYSYGDTTGSASDLDLENGFFTVTGIGVVENETTSVVFLLKDVFGNESELEYKFLKASKPQIGNVSILKNNDYIPLGDGDVTNYINGVEDENGKIKVNVYVDVTASNAYDISGVQYSTNDDYSNPNNFVFDGSKYVAELEVGTDKGITYYIWAYDEKNISYVKEITLKKGDDKVEVSSFNLKEERVNGKKVKNIYVCFDSVESGIVSVDVKYYNSRNEEITKTNLTCIDGKYLIEDIEDVKKTYIFTVKTNTIGDNEKECSYTASDRSSVQCEYDYWVNNSNQDEYDVELTFSNNVKEVNSIKYSIALKDSTEYIVENVSVAKQDANVIKLYNLINQENSPYTDGEYVLKITTSCDVQRRSNPNKTVEETIDHIVEFGIDRVAPSYTLNFGGEDNYYTEDNMPTFEVTGISDATSGIKDAYVEIYKGEGRIVEILNSGLTWNGDKFSVSDADIFKAIASSNGTYTIKVKVSDMAGNSSESDCILNIDNSSVNFESEIEDFVENSDGSNEWINIDSLSDKILTINGFELGNYTPGKLTFTITSVDDSSKTYSFVKDSLTNDSSETIDLSALGDLVLEDGKKYKIEILATNSQFDDNKSLSENSEYTYKYVSGIMGVDISAPNPENITISTEYDEDWVNKPIEIEIDGTDNSGSDVKYYYYITEDNSAAPSDSSVIKNANNVLVLNGKKAKISVSTSGEYNVYLCAEDKAGNVSEVIKFEKEAIEGADRQLYVLRFDYSKPETDVQVEDGVEYVIVDGIKWYTGNVSIKYSMWNHYSDIEKTKTEGSLVNSTTSIKVSGYAYDDETKKYVGTAKTDKEGIWNTAFTAFNKFDKEKADILTFGIDLKEPTFESKITVKSNNKIDNVYMSNSTIEISGTVSDGKGSGIKKVEMLDANGKVIADEDKNVASYKFTLKDEKTYKGYKLRVTDNVGKTTEKILNEMIISKSGSSVTTNYSDGYVEVEGKKWYGSDVPVSFEVKNTKTGINTISVSVNGKPVTTEKNISKNGKVTSKTITVNTKGYAINTDDNSYKITVKVKDNAGNEPTFDDAVVYKDTKGPEVLGYEFEDNDFVKKLEDDNYGYFFTKDTKIKVSVEDQAYASGLKSISLYTIAADAKNNTKTNFATKNTTNGTAEFIIPAGFKGRIYAYGTDMVGNVGNKNKVLAGTIIETEELHKDYSAISFEVEETPYTDVDGRPLYKQDEVPVTIKIKDTFSGIQSISLKVVSDDTNANAINESLTIDAQGNISGSMENITKDKNDVNLVTEITKELVVNHNSNNIRVTVVLKDNAGYELKKTFRISIDKTAPQVNVRYNNVTPDSNNIFNADRVATITVTERNFDEKDFVVNITNTDGAIPQISDWTTVPGTGNGDDTTHRATVTFSNDGDYTFGMSYSDKAKQEATVNDNNAVAPNEFTIDKTRPVLTVAYDNNAAANGNYYQDRRVATITINEHNFDAGRVNVTVRENGTEVNRAVTAWNTNGDNHTATLEFNTEAEFAINATCTDMAGNEAQNAVNDSFIIDTEVPKMLITGVEDNKAYKDSTVGVTVTAADAHFDVLDVVLLQYDSKGDSKQIPLTGIDIASGKEFSISNLSEDAIYTLTSTVRDKAGREVTDSRTFSVNRNGSTFAITDEATLSLKGAYINEANDIVIYETNVNKLNMDKISVMIYKNSEAIELVKGQDYDIKVEENDGQWCKYTYTIKKENFVEDASYKVAIYSEDMASNIALSESKDKGAEFGFVVDNTKPICNVYDLKSGTTYGVDSKTVEFMPEDNIELKSVAVLINGKESMNLSGKELNELLATGSNLSFVIDSSTSSQKVVIKCTDMAGNESEIEIKGFYVTTNLWVQYSTNTTLVVISIIAAVAVLGLIVFLVARKKKSR